MVDKVVETYTIGQIVQALMGYAPAMLFVGVIIWGLWYYRSLFAGAISGVRSFAGGLFSGRRRAPAVATASDVLTFEEASSYAKALADYHKAHGCEEGYQHALKAGQCLFSEGKADATKT